MKKSAFLSDLFFAFFVGFVLSLCLFRYLRLSLPLAVFCASLFGGACAALLFFPLNDKRKKVVSEHKEAIERDNLVLYLALLPERKRDEFFKELLFEPDRYDEPPPEIKYVNGLYAVETREEIFFPVFTVRPIDGDLAAQILRTETNKRKVLLCASTAPETDKLLSRFSVTTKRADEVFRQIKEKKMIPESYPFENEQPSKIAAKTRLWFAKKNARAFLTGGATLLLASWLTPFPLYYWIFGGVLIAVSVFVRVFGYR